MEIVLHQLSFAGPTTGPRLLIIGGVHGDEFEPIVAIRELARVLAATTGPGRGPRGRVTLVPVVNEAAFQRGDRVAEDGLDLARTCPGLPDGTVTERTAWAVSPLIRETDFLIDLHTGGTKLGVLPLVGYTLHPDQRVLDVQRRMARAFGLPVVWGTSPDLEGRTLSVAREAGVPAIYAEYLGSGTCHPAGVTAYVEGCLNVMGALGLVDRDVPTPVIERHVEDARPGSGHLQACDPAPIAGCFVPAVALGQSVRSGDLLGLVFDPVGRDEREIRARQAGIVLALRTFPRVAAGESLCVILETADERPASGGSDRGGAEGRATHPA